MATEELGEVEGEERPYYGCWWRRPGGVEHTVFGARNWDHLEGFGRVCMRHVLSQLLFQAPDILIQQFVSEMNDSKDVFYSDIYCLTV